MSFDKHFYLIDGSNYIFRAYYAIRPLSTSQGLPTNAIYGFTQMLLKLAKEAKPQYWAIVFDSKEPNFRDHLYKEYKANRKEPPDDLVPQFEYFPKVVEALNIPMLIQPGFEADDIIATMALQARAQNFNVTIISGDKDLMQLVGEKIDVWDTMKEKHYGIPEVIEKMGVPPEKITDLLGLMGDTSDNIPGIPGIGPKTAKELVKEFGSLESLLKNKEKLKGKIKENVDKYADLAKLSKQLATLETTVPVKFETQIFQYQSLDPQKCHDLFHELEFSRLLSEVVPKATLSKKDYRLVLDLKELKELADFWKETRPMLAIDTETTSLNVFQAKIVGFSFAWGKGQAAYLPVGHEGLGLPKQIPLEEVVQILKPIFENTSVPKVGQNLKYDLAILNRLGFSVANIFCDTMIASYLLNPQGPHNLDDLAQQHLDHRTIHYEEVVGKGAKQKSFAEVPLELARDYSGEDADCTWQLAEKFMPQLQENHLLPLFRDLEMPLMEILLKMELTGVKVDPEILKKLSKEFETMLQKIETKIYQEAKGPFNINSPKQLGEVLFGRLNLPGGKKTKTGFSTSQEVLENMSPAYPIVDLILQFRSLSKLKSTYADALLTLINQETGRIHTSFNQTVAATGRLSSSEPNLQNIPIRSGEGKKIRTAFIAEPQFVLLSADYSQIELRILAHFTEDSNLTSAFQRGEDVHQLTANALNIDRGAAKTVNFAVIYGQTPYGLSQQLKIEPQSASFYIENYFKKYPKVKSFREKALEEARHKGFVTTLFNRRRFVPDLLSHNIHMKNNAERMAFNTIFQGSAADIIKKAMIDIDQELTKISPKTRMILQVHDELIFEIPEKEVEKVEEFVKNKMESAFNLKVPLVVDCGIGKNWAEAH